MVKMIDRQVGEILALLKELGIDENTIVFVSGDNGGQPYFLNGDPSKPRPKEPPYPHGFFGPNLNPQTGVRFRGGKGNLYEGGLRIPMIVRWPGKIKPGRVSDHLWYFPDVMPTWPNWSQPNPSTTSTESQSSQHFSAKKPPRACRKTTNSSTGSMDLRWPSEWAPSRP